MLVSNGGEYFMNISIGTPPVGLIRIANAASDLTFEKSPFSSLNLKFLGLFLWRQSQLSQSIFHWWLKQKEGRPPFFCPRLGWPPIYLFGRCSGDVAWFTDLSNDIWFDHNDNRMMWDDCKRCWNDEYRCLDYAKKTNLAKKGRWFS